MVILRPKTKEKRRSKKKDVIHLAFNDQNPEIRGIGPNIWDRVDGRLHLRRGPILPFRQYGGVIILGAFTARAYPAPDSPYADAHGCDRTSIYSAELLIMFIVLIALIIMLIYGVHRTYKGLSYLGGYVPHTGAGQGPSSTRSRP